MESYFSDAQHIIIITVCTSTNAVFALIILMLPLHVPDSFVTIRHCKVMFTLGYDKCSQCSLQEL